MLQIIPKKKMSEAAAKLLRRKEENKPCQPVRQELYLVTGAAGHLGSAVVRELLARQKSVRALILPGETNLPPAGAEVFRGDVCDPGTLREFFANPEQKELYVIHCAGIVTISSGFQQRVYDVNVGGTRNMVALCMEHHVKRLVYVSSVHAIPEKPRGQVISETRQFSPAKVNGFYAKTKAQATACVLHAAHRGLDACVVHPSGISGPFDCGSGHITALVCDYMNHRLAAGAQGGYDFVDVRDVARGVVDCCTLGRRGECYILSNRYYSVGEILRILHEVTGEKEVKCILPYWFVKMTAPAAELYYKAVKRPPLFTAYSVYTLHSNANFSHAKATKELNYHPRDIRQTLADTARWLMEQKRVPAKV